MTFNLIFPKEIILKPSFNSVTVSDLKNLTPDKK